MRISFFIWPSIFIMLFSIMLGAFIILYQQHDYYVHVDNQYQQVYQKYLKQYPDKAVLFEKHQGPKVLTQSDADLLSQYRQEQADAYVAVNMSWPYRNVHTFMKSSMENIFRKDAMSYSTNSVFDK